MSDAEEYEFIDLDRTFHALSKYAEESDDNDIRHAFLTGKRLGWVDLTQEYRTVILSEAGSGKTEEIRNVARTLKAQGKPAFFLRLEHVTSDFEDAFEIGAFEEFEAWLESNDEGWLLLDLVDEARLRDPGDFHLAILRLGKRIASAKQRAHIVITSRNSAWRPKTDLAHCKQHLGYVRPTKEAKPEDEQTSDERVKIRDRSDRKEAPEFKIVTLDDLDSPQIKKFAAANGVQDTDAFINAIERADAWSFTARPQDLQELAEYWNDHQVIGSRLAERDQKHADAHPISAERARTGARLVDQRSWKAPARRNASGELSAKTRAEKPRTAQLPSV